MFTRFALLCLLSLIAPCYGDVFVAPTGNDANDGTAAKPLATLDAARLLVRTQLAAQGAKPANIVVHLAAGTYPFSKSVLFTAADSGTTSAVITYQGANDGPTIFTGGTALPRQAFTLVDATSPWWSVLPTSSHGYVFECSLASLGIADLGSLTVRGFGNKNIAQLELFENGHPLTLARWPNAGELAASTGSVLSPTSFVLKSSRPELWKQSPEIWVHGFWGFSWADYHLPVSAIDSASESVTLASPPPQFGLTSGMPFYAYNIAEELDQPGEYYIDRATGTLLVWPKRPIAQTSFSVSTLKTPLISLTGTSNVVFDRITFENSRSSLILSNAIDRVRFTRCLLRNAGQLGASLVGTNSGVDASEVVDTGEIGVQLTGGDRATLTPANNFVSNSRIHRTGRVTWSYNPGVHLNQGCGNRVTRNLIDDVPHAAVLFWGNDHVMEANEIRDACLETSDAAAIYTSRDLGSRGNVIRGNFIHDVISKQSGNGVYGVYIDDGSSGPSITGNIFYNISNVGINCGGGRDITMTNNVIDSCGIGHLNDDRARRDMNNTPGDSWNLLETLKNARIKPQTPPWSTRFPELAALPTTWEELSTGLWRNPEGCTFSTNAGFNNFLWTRENNTSGTGVFSVYKSIANNNPSVSTGLTPSLSYNRSSRPATLSVSLGGFQPIAFSQIGLPVAAADVSTLPPPAPEISGTATSDTEARLSWIDYSNLEQNAETAFKIERRNEPDGSWQVVHENATDENVYLATGLAPSTTYRFRVTALNRSGSSVSNEVALHTHSMPSLPTTPSTFEAETGYKIDTEIANFGVISVSAAELANGGKALRLYDPGDAVSYTFNLPAAGKYVVSARIRTGSNESPTNFLPAGYTLRIDSQSAPFSFDPSSLSALDTRFGGTYWGTVQTEVLPLEAGTHTLQITSNSSFAVLDSFSYTRYEEPRATSYATWAGFHFTADQLASPEISGAAASASGDGYGNLVKYALGVDPWTVLADWGVTVTVPSNALSLTYSRPAGLSDMTFTVEVSDDSATWVPLVSTLVSTKDHIETVQAEDNTGSPHRYIRLSLALGTQVVSSLPLTSSDYISGDSIGSGPNPPNPGPASRLTNISMRARTGSGEATPIVGFAVRGSDLFPVVVRGVGPTLTVFGVSGAMTDPKITLFSGQTLVAVNDNWGGTSVLSRAFEATGAFTLPSSSLDAALLRNIAPTNFTAFPQASDGNDGVVLLEAYALRTQGVSRLVNISVRANAGRGASSLIAGFAVSGTAPLTVLIRGVGPTLSQFGLTTALPDSTLTLNNGALPIAFNDNWNANVNVEALRAASLKVGAFTLPSDSSDAALLVTLDPGVYTAVVGSANEAQGVALVEVYSVE